MGEGWNDPYRSDDDAYKVNERMGVEAFFSTASFPSPVVWPSIIVIVGSDPESPVKEGLDNCVFDRFFSCSPALSGNGSSVALP